MCTVTATLDQGTLNTYKALDNALAKHMQASRLTEEHKALYRCTLDQANTTRHTMQHLQLAKQQTCFLCTTPSRVKGDEDTNPAASRDINIYIYIHIYIERDIS